LRINTGALSEADAQATHADNPESLRTLLDPVLRADREAAQYA